jgi:hypothetical protein
VVLQRNLEEKKGDANGLVLGPIFLLQTMKA